MDNRCTDAYSYKAEKYAKYRWDYAPEAIQLILETAHVSTQSCVADIGSGTGILAGHFVQRVDQVFAVEPNAPMRQWAARALAQYPAFCGVDGRAEATTLPDHSVALILAGQALHWFEPEATRSEFLRILRPGGWLAVLWNHGTDAGLNKAFRSVFVPENGWDASGGQISMHELVSFYFGEKDIVHECFPQSEEQDREAFIGAICSNSHAPDEEHPLYENLVQAAQNVFDAFSVGGRIKSSFSTELRLGQIEP